MQQFPRDILSDISDHLIQEKKKLISRITELKVQDPFHDTDRASDNAASDTEGLEESNHDRVSALVDALTLQAESIDRALLRIEDGTYGYCTSCKQMIDTDRLSILPMATLCRSCEDTKKHR